MARFRFNEGDLELPDGWEDRSVIALSFPAGAPTPEASLAITRDALAGKEPSLAAYIDKQIVDLTKSCPRFELSHRENTRLGDTPAQRLEFTWRSPNGASIRQQQTICLLAKGVALTFTATTEDARFGAYADVFRRIVEQIRLRP